MDNKLLEYLSSKLDERRKALIDTLGDGGAQTYDQYQNLCGQVRGLLAAQFEINDLLRNLKEHDE